LARKILLADDSVTAQNMGRRILSDAGYEVVTVNNGAAALKKIGEIKPDLIILDVYMPGYGGLEVCQRIKEAPETARIPVLLTVGKMEPFKAEEAKRVRADSYIIKPFEASELLTALAKLEDRIVPVADNKKSGRSGKAASNQAAAQKVEAGDLEWKNRLRIPAPSAKSSEGEPGAAKRGPEAAQPDSGFRDLERKQDPGSASPNPIGAHRSPASDITPDDIAAMVSATNGGSKPGKPSDAPENLTASKDQSWQENSEAEAATLASAPVDSASRQVEPAGLLGKPELESSRDDLRHLAASEADVTAMLESLQPARGNERAVAKGDRDVIASGESPALVETNVGGPRWIAHPVALTEHEATLMLEHEMAKTLAACAVEEATRNSDMPTPEETASVMRELLSVVAYAEATAAVQSRPVGDAGGSHRSSDLASIEPPKAEPQGHEATSSAYPESSEGAASGASILGQEISQSDAVSEVGQTSLPESLTPESQEEGAAFAAAAAAGTVTLEQAIAQYAASHEHSLERPSENPALTGQKPDHQAERQKETELAAAWQSWKQIRETVVGTRSVAQIVSELNIESCESAASGDAGFKDMRREPGAAAGPAKEKDNEAAVEAKASDQAIASIVDSVLADLKPRLMEEIARKMAKEKEKEKEREKEKE
jgi:CheY-like chemotaxis protein